MNILFLSAEPPFPADSGGRIRVSELVLGLSASHRVDVICSAPRGMAEAARAQSRDHGINCEVIEMRDDLMRQALGLARSVVTRRPYVTYKHRAESLRTAVRKATAARRYDAVLVSLHYVTDAATGVGVPVVVDFHNIDHVLYRRLAKTRSGLGAVHARRQFALMREYERNIPRRVAWCTTVSEADGDVLRNISGCTNISTVCNGVRTNVMKRDGPMPLADVDLLFVGSLAYHPNADAVEWLLSTLMPSMWQKRPQATLAVIGAGGSSSLKAAAASDDRIRYYGRVPDVRPYYERARVALIPLRSGAGTKLKVIEAASMETPMVMTPVSAEGLSFEDGVHCVIRESADALVAATLELLSSQENAQQIARRARQVVVDEYDWSIQVARMEAVLMRAVAS